MKGDPSAYEDFIKMMLDAGIIRFGRQSQVMVKPFFVHKKGGRLRLILECRPANRHFKEATRARLGTSSEWCGLVLPEGGVPLCRPR